MTDFNPNSYDAQLARVLEILHAQNMAAAVKNERDREDFKKIMEKQDTTNGRVLGLEKREQYNKGKVAGIAVACSTGISIISYLINQVL